jgi:hypothetical protein
VSKLKRAFPETPNQHRSVLCGTEVLADVPGHSCQFSDHGCRSERIEQFSNANRSSRSSTNLGARRPYLLGTG